MFEISSANLSPNSEMSPNLAALCSAPASFQLERSKHCNQLFGRAAFFSILLLIYVAAARSIFACQTSEVRTNDKDSLFPSLN
jgi:hypothetical protein